MTNRDLELLEVVRTGVTMLRLTISDPWELSGLAIDVYLLEEASGTLRCGVGSGSLGSTRQLLLTPRYADRCHAPTAVGIRGFLRGGTVEVLSGQRPSLLALGSLAGYDGTSLT